MKKCIFILPYFGTFKNYFSLFLKSCGKNRDFAWLLITDNTVPYPIPDNVRIISMTFDELRKKIQAKFDFEIALPNPYKLCDFKPSYGFVFEDQIQDYEWWGYCDCDLLLGNLSEFLFPLFRQQYDKIFAIGHMTIFQNTKENNRRFMKPYHGKELYRRAFTAPGICWFDEDYWTEAYGNENIHHIFLEDGGKVYEKDLCFNVGIFGTQFCRTVYMEGTGKFLIQPYERAVYVWDDGDLKRIVKTDGGQLRTEHFLYMHFQGRKMKYQEGILSEPLIQIYPNGFCRLEKLPESQKEWARLSGYSPNLHFVRRKWNNVKLRLRGKRNG